MEINMVIDNETVDNYSAYYFMKHPRAHVPPIKHPYHESINVWMVMKRPAMNALKQKWKDFITWLIQEQGYTNLHINQCEMCFKTYYGNNRKHDCDNSVPKFILDGFVQAGMIDDDSSVHLTKLILECACDTENPRTEIKIVY